MKDRRQEREAKPSLLGRESSGGDVAEGGFSYQESVMMSYVPAWLADEGFEEMTRESIGDIEAKFFVPGCERARELIEVKNHRIAPSEFWEEVRRFRNLDNGSPDTFHRFVLVGKELGEDLKRLKNGLERVRGPRSFYEGTPIEEASLAGFAKIVVGMEHSEDDAHFLLQRVEIRDDLTTNEAHWRGVFSSELFSHFPEYEDLSGKILGDVYEGLVDLLRSRRNRSIARKEVERRIRERIPEAVRPPARPVVVRTLIGDEKEEAGPKIRPIRLDWEEFFGGSTRSYPPPEEWDERLVRELAQTKDWILRHRGAGRIRFTGNRRLSTALAIGATFSAVAGFSAEVENRGGGPWATDAHPTADTPAFPLDAGGSVFPGERLVVSIGVTREIASEVDEALGALGLAGMPTLHLYGAEAVRSAEHANKAVRALKDEVVDALSRSGADHVDLFFAGPSPLALFLGHRLNATATIRCYEWVSRGTYVPTCEIA